MIKIPLQVEGVDLSSDAVLEAMDPDLDELDWITQGPLTLAIVYSEERAPRAAVAEAHDWVLRIHKLQPGATVLRVFDELVGWNEIAVRCGVSPEAVRTWARGLRRGQAPPFPAPRQAVPLGAGKRSLQLYAWREVLAWIREVLGLDPDEDMTYLDDAGLLELDSYIAGESRSPAPETYTPLPSRVLPAHGQLETKIHATLDTFVRQIDPAEALAGWDQLTVHSLLLKVADTSWSRSQGTEDKGTKVADLSWAAEERSSLA